MCPFYRLMANYSVNVTMQQEEHFQSGYRGHEDYRAALVSLPLPVAAVCCVLNFIIPGLGTIVSGFASLCCSRENDRGCSAKCSLCASSIVIGLLQLILTVFLLVGWLWSCIWGVMFIGLSHKAQNGQDLGTNLEGAAVYMGQPSINIHFHHMSTEMIPEAPPTYEELEHVSFASESLVDLHSEPTSDADERPPPYMPP